MQRLQDTGKRQQSQIELSSFHPRWIRQDLNFETLLLEFADSVVKGAAVDVELLSPFLRSGHAVDVNSKFSRLLNLRPATHGHPHLARARLFPADLLDRITAFLQGP